MQVTLAIVFDFDTLAPDSTSGEIFDARRQGGSSRGSERPEGQAPLAPSGPVRTLYGPDCDTADELQSFLGNLERAIATRPREIVLRFVGVSQLAPDPALLLHHILHERAIGGCGRRSGEPRPRYGSLRAHLPDRDGGVASPGWRRREPGATGIPWHHGFPGARTGCLSTRIPADVSPRPRAIFRSSRVLTDLWSR